MRKVAVLLILLAFPLGCRHNTTTPVPIAQGFVNQYDQDTFNGLITAQAAITQAKTSFGSNPSAKVPLNAAIKAYNDARTGYLTWHAAAAVSATANHSTLDNLVSILLGAIAAVNQQFGVTAPAPASSRITTLQPVEAL